MGGMQCTHLLSTCSDGSPVYILDTSDGVNPDLSKNLLSLKYLDVNSKHPDFETVHESTLKKIDISFSSVNFTIHQVGFFSDTFTLFVLNSFFSF